MKRTVRKQPNRKVKRRRKNTKEPMEYDMIGILLSNYGMTRLEKILYVKYSST